MQGVLFVASLTDYIYTLWEDNDINTLYENVNLFGELSRLEKFDNSKFVLLLTKDDILKSLLLNNDNGLIKCFGKNTGSWNQYLKDDIEKIKNNNKNTNIDEKEKEIEWIQNILDNNIETWDQAAPNNSDNDCDTSFEEYHASVVDFIKKLFCRRYKNRDLDGDVDDQIMTHVVVASQRQCVDKVFAQIAKVLLQNNVVPL